MSTVRAHQRKILEIPKLVEVLSSTKHYSFMSKIKILSRDPVPVNMKKPLQVIIDECTVFYASHFTTNFLSSDETISKGF
jgi:hypothetical protein